MAEKIEFDLKVGVNELDKALNNAVTGSKKLGDTVSTALGVFGGGIALKGFELLGDAVSSTTDFIKDSVKAAAEQEDALNKLSQALRATGSFSEQAVDNFSQFASELQKTSLFADDVIIGQIAIAKSLGATNQQAKELIQAAANLAATFGGSLEENVFKLGKTLSGVVNRDLKAAVPELKGLGSEALAAGKAISIINNQFSGAALSQLDSYSGRIAQLNKAIGEFQESIGNLVINSGITDYFETYSQVINDVTEAISDGQIEADRQREGFVETASTIAQLTRKLNELKVEAIDAEQIVNNPSFFDTLLARPLQAAKNLKNLNLEISAIQETINKANAATPPEQEDAKPVGENLAEQQINAVALKNAEILALDKELLVEQQRLATDSNALFLENEALQKQAILESELQFQLDKNQIIFDQQLASSELLGSEQERAAARSVAIKQKEIADLRAAGKFQQEIDKQAIESSRIVAQEKIANLQRVSQVTQQVSDLASSVAKDGSTTQFAINKAFALGQIGIARATGIANALLLPPPAQPAAIAFANITAGLAAAQVAASAIKFEQGGIVGQGATTGPDNRIATIRDGELILNAAQQKTLFDAINSGNLGGGDIVVQIDSKEIARAVRKEIRGGFKIA